MKCKAKMTSELSTGYNRGNDGIVFATWELEE